MGHSRLSSLRDADTGSIEVLLQTQVVLCEPPELELAHRLLSRSGHHLAGEVGDDNGRCEGLAVWPRCCSGQKDVPPPGSAALCLV